MRFPMNRPLLLLVLSLTFGPLSAQEICNNGLDDDNNGLIDLNDSTACNCSNLAAGSTESLIPNPSFEDNNCLPSSWSQLNCATGWEQATTATSDYFNSDGYFPSMIPLPPPDGNGVAGLIMLPDWREYLGACLINPMLAGEQYSINFNVASAAPNGTFSGSTPIYFGPVAITIFGLANCVTFPINTTTCPEGQGWIELGSVVYTPTNSWSLQNITFTPTFDVATIMIGPPCDLPADYDSQGSYLPYFYIDNLLLAEDIPYDATIDPLGGWCTNDLVLQANPDSLTGDYQWYQGGVALVGETGLTLDISGNGSSLGTYQFRYQINDSICVTVPFDVELPPTPQPNFTISDPVGCAPHTTSFTNTTTGVVSSSCAWSFGDGITGNTCDTVITYDTPGTYDVTLTITSSEGCVGDTTFLAAVTVVAPPTAAFVPDLTQGCQPLTVQFTNSSTGTWTDCTWDFGDSGTSSVCDPTYTYADAGIYSVALSISTGGICGNDTIMDALIEVLPSPVLTPVADDPAGCRPHTVQFDQAINSGAAQLCTWTFGNGDGSSDCATTATYDQAGVFTVTLAVEGTNGCVSDTVLTDWITVYDLPTPDLSASVTAACPPFATTFTNTTPPGQSASCQWAFGDGGTSANCNPTYIYQVPGTYPVSLTVTSPQGCVQDTVFDPYITVYQPPVASFTVDDPTQCRYFPFTFTNTSIGSVDCTWDLGDMTTVAACNVVHTYAAAGIYDVELTVTSAEGCVDDTLMAAFITAIPEPIPLFVADTVQGCEPLAIQFTNLTVPTDVAQADWTFGDGVASTANDPAHIYQQDGTYSVGLTITAPSGCVSDTLFPAYITAWDLPEPALLATPTIGCPPLSVEFTNATPTGQTTSVLWNFGDGTGTDDPEPTHLYPFTGIYDVSLTVVSPLGCVGDSTFPAAVTVLGKPAADFLFGPAGADVYWPRYDLIDASSPDAVQWWWSFGEDGILGTDSVQNTSFIFPGEDAAEYPVTLIVADSNGCLDTTMRVLPIDGVLTVHIPNSFTPNGDGVNDVFAPVIRDAVPGSYRLTIFDRWGQEQFTSTDTALGWDGNIGGTAAKQDVYVWRLEVLGVRNTETQERIGHVTLLR